MVGISNKRVTHSIQDRISPKDESLVVIANPDTRSSQTADHSSEPPGYMPLVRRTRDWELDRANINVVKIIGKGTFSRVGKATAAGIPGTRGEVTVAVKMLKCETTKSVSVFRIAT